MKKLLIIGGIVYMFLFPCGVNAAYNQEKEEPPPVSQTLVREGDFAIELAKALGLVFTDNEAEAESMLASLDISPANGWFADYPMTPDIIGELKDSVGLAADSGKIAMTREEALGTFENLLLEQELPIDTENDSQYAEEQQSSECSEETSEYDKKEGKCRDSEEIKNYYDERGPPVITYYRPPYYYDYLYFFVPYAFWYHSAHYDGYYIIRNFHIVHRHHHPQHHKKITGRKVISNHFFDKKTERFERIIPLKRNTGSIFGIQRDISKRAKAFASDRKINSTNSFRHPGKVQGEKSFIKPANRVEGRSVKNSGTLLHRSRKSSMSFLKPNIPQGGKQFIKRFAKTGGKLLRQSKPFFSQGTRSIKPLSRNFGKTFSRSFRR